MRTALATPDREPEGIRYPKPGETWQYASITISVRSCRVAKNGSVVLFGDVGPGESIELRTNKHGYHRLITTGGLTTWSR